MLEAGTCLNTPLTSSDHNALGVPRLGVVSGGSSTLHLLALPPSELESWHKRRPSLVQETQYSPLLDPRQLCGASSFCDLRVPRPSTWTGASAPLQPDPHVMAPPPSWAHQSHKIRACPPSCRRWAWTLTCP
ncbi:hypothetical protein AAFF_G00221980 [Aldrovandia affinis]|uniref:Uncharacterized protein n=1 Tax=Aldrovandia affinis TaxID=143900 RepID=A0AAD7W4N2_9TELE|nr:hypothetical protein AAFF_G00221980 [Aldrovandia affinis]